MGSIFNVTRERVRQIEAKALRKLRHPIRSRKLKAFLDHRLKVDAKIAAMPMETKVADISADLRQAKAR